jgi:hypothetical protein
MRPVLAVLVGLALAACQAATPVEMSDPRVAAGGVKSCADLGLSDVRCTLLKLRAARELETLRPDAEATEQELHEAVAPPAGQSPIPGTQVAVAVVVFTLDDGSSLGVPVLCPREPPEGDPACNPQTQ